MKARLVSAFVELEGDRPRSPAEYHALAESLYSLPVPKAIYRHQLDTCWMHGAVIGKPYQARTDNYIEKNTMGYHIVQHQKTTWMLQAAAEHPDAEVLVWMDYGIFHMEGITQQRIIDFMAVCEDEQEIAIPGSWPKGQNGGPCWRFNGSVLICHRKYLSQLDHAIRVAAMRHAADTGTIIWEVNAWDTVETVGTLPIRWYAAAHNGTMLTDYRRKSA